MNALEEKIKADLNKALNTAEWKRYKHFTVFVSKKGLPTRIIARPTIFGYMGNINPMAFDSFPIRRGHERDVDEALKYLNKIRNNYV